MRKVLVSDLGEVALVDGLLQRPARLNGERVLLMFSAAEATRGMASVQKVLVGKILPWPDRRSREERKPEEVR